MENIGPWLLRLTGCALICAVVLRFFGEKAIIGSAVKLLCSVTMAIAVVSPWTSLDLHGFFSSLRFADIGGEYAADGENSAKESMAQIISEKTGAYILDKANSLGASLQVTLTLTEDRIPVPCGAVLQGRISPYGKQVLSSWMEDALNIPKEAQQWQEDP